MIRSDTFSLQGSLTGRWGRLMIFALAILRVFSSLPVFRFIILLCGPWSLWFGASMSYREFMDLFQFNANSQFLARHFRFDRPNTGHPCITIYLLQYIGWVPCQYSKSEPWSLVSSLLWPLIWESNIFHLVYSTYCQPFHSLSGLAVIHQVVSKAQWPCRNRAWAHTKISSYSVYSLLEGESGHGGAPPLLHSHQSSQVPERESVHCGAPLSCTNLLPLRHFEHLLPSIPHGSARRDESTSDSDPKWSPCLSGSPPVAAMDGSKEISLSLLFRDGRSKVIYLIQVCWRELGPHQEGLLWPSHEVHWIPCWLGSYLSSSSLMTFIPPSILGSSRLVGLLAVLLLRHLLVLLHLLSGWASLHPGEELLRGSWVDWGCCDGTFHMFHQVLGWSSCLRSPTNRHAVVGLGRSFHRTHLVIYGSITLQLSLRRLRCVPVPMHSPSVVSRTPMTIVQRTGIRRH